MSKLVFFPSLLHSFFLLFSCSFFFFFPFCFNETLIYAPYKVLEAALFVYPIFKCAKQRREICSSIISFRTSSNNSEVYGRQNSIAKSCRRNRLVSYGKPLIRATFWSRVVHCVCIIIPQEIVDRIIKIIQTFLQIGRTGRLDVSGVIDYCLGM